MAYPSATLYPSTTLFPGVAAASGVDGLAVTLGTQILTGTDTSGVQWRTGEVIGWDASPASSRQFTQKTRAPGAWSSTRNAAARSIVLNGQIYCPSIDLLQGALDQLAAAVTFEDTVLTVTRGSTTRSAIVARQDEMTVTQQGPRVFGWSIQLGAGDPRKFTAALSGNTRLPSSTGGFTFPLTFPWSFTETVTSGRLQLTNPGTATGPVVLRIDGPIVGPQVTHVTTGTPLVFSSSLSLNTGEYLTVDMEAQTALLNDQSSRNSTLTSRGWSGFSPATVNEWDFTAQSGSGRLTVTATPAWL